MIAVEPVVVAAIQAAPVFLDREATVDKACGLGNALQELHAPRPGCHVCPGHRHLPGPTWDNSDVWIPTLRHIAKEGRVFVVGVNFCMRGSDAPADIPGRDAIDAGDEDWPSRGNTAIVGPEGELLAGPLMEEEGIVLAEIDANRARASRRQFDPVGHYSRSDVFTLTVDTRPKPAARFDG